MSNQPHGNLAIRTLAMPTDANPSGDIFGGWVLSQMDIAASTCAVERAQCRTVTVALDAMSFISPVKIGDVLSVYTELKKVGNTSMDIYVEAWATRGRIGEMDKVTEAMFKFVAVDENGLPTPVLAIQISN
jgi:acyl-CoA thioesterase YciA